MIQLLDMYVGLNTMTFIYIYTGYPNTTCFSRPTKIGSWLFTIHCFTLVPYDKTRSRFVFGACNTMIFLVISLPDADLRKLLAQPKAGSPKVPAV